ncbi:MAG: hypothetical protein ACKO2P_05110 [Planctomycetota bacterium]
MISRLSSLAQIAVRNAGPAGRESHHQHSAASVDHRMAIVVGVQNTRGIRTGTT